MWSSDFSDKSREALRSENWLRSAARSLGHCWLSLLTHLNEVVSRDTLIEALWPDRRGDGGTASTSRSHGCEGVRAGGLAEDAERRLRPRGRAGAGRRASVRATARGGRRQNAAGQHSEALATLDAAVALWRGAPLADLAYEDFARPEIERLEELRLVATEERSEAELALGRHDTLVPELEALTAKHGPRERLRSQLMLALYRSGRHAEALRVFADTRKQLIEDLGMEPSRQLRGWSRRSSGRIPRWSFRGRSSRGGLGRSAHWRSCWPPR